MKGNNFLSITDLTSDEVRWVVQESVRIKKEPTSHHLSGRVIALIFEKPSVRTRVSFEVGIRQMGGECIYLSRDDVGLGVRESESDVVRVLQRWVDVIVARVFSHSTLQALVQDASIPVVNALSDLEHPCQAIGDMLTIYECKGGLEGLKIVFVGDGNNVASSLALACASVGAHFTLASPKGHRIPEVLWEESKRRASENGSGMSWVAMPQEAVRDADVVYTDVWTSMGQEDQRKERLKAFAAYQVNEELMAAAKPETVFMHDMPARRGEEISEGMLDHPGSVVFDQAENRLHAQKAILVSILGTNGVAH